VVKYFAAEILCLWLFRKPLEGDLIECQEVPCGFDLTLASTEIKGDSMIL